MLKRRNAEGHECEEVRRVEIILGGSVSRLLSTCTHEHLESPL